MLILLVETAFLPFASFMYSVYPVSIASKTFPRFFGVYSELTVPSSLSFMTRRHTSSHFSQLTIEEGARCFVSLSSPLGLDSKSRDRLRWFDVLDENLSTADWGSNATREVRVVVGGVEYL